MPYKGGYIYKKNLDNYSINAYFEGEYQSADTKEKELLDTVEKIAIKLKRKDV